MKKFNLAILFIILSGCASFDTNRIAPGYIEAYKAIKKTYFQDNKLDLSPDEIKAIPYASALLRIGKGSEGLIILESLNGDEETWVSADGLFLVINKGRIIKTAGLTHNLINFKSSIDLTAGSNLNSKYYQYYSYDEPSLNDLRIKSEMFDRGLRNVILFDREKKLRLIEENINSEIHGWSFTNKYWLNETGFVVKSKQKISPKLPFFELEITKKPAR